MLPSRPTYIITFLIANAKYQCKFEKIEKLTPTCISPFLLSPLEKTKEHERYYEGE